MSPQPLWGGTIAIKGVSAVHEGRGRRGKIRQLERVVIGDDEDKFFRSEFNCLLEKGKS